MREILRRNRKMCKKALSWLLALSMILSLFISMPLAAEAEGAPAAVFSDGDLDHVYFLGDTLSFNISGLPVGTGEGQIPVGTPLRVSLGLADQSESFTSANILSSGLTDGSADGTGYYTACTLAADGSLSPNISGTIAASLAAGMIAVQIFYNPTASWVNIMQGQPQNYIPLMSGENAALMGLDAMLVMPTGVTSDPVLGAGAQDTENLREMSIAFTKTIASGVTGSIAFNTGLDILDNSSLLEELDTALIMSPVAEPTGGAYAQYTIGVDVSDAALSFLAATGATVWVTSASFDGLMTGYFSAVAADVSGGTVSGLTFSDADNSVYFNVNHFSSYTLSMADPDGGTALSETVYQNAAAGLAGAKIYDAVALSGGDIGALMNMSGSVLYGVLDVSLNKWTTVRLSMTASSDANAASLALDALGNPHVVFVNSDNDIVYRYDTGSGWTLGRVIDSMNVGSAGALSCPDIAIDGSGYAHITYIDTQGGYSAGRDYYNYADIMYATNTTGTFVRTIKIYGDGSYGGDSSTVDFEQPSGPSKIALTAANYSIGGLVYKKQGNSYSNSYYYRIARLADTLSLALTEGTNSPNSLGFSLFEMDSDGTNAYSLFNKSSGLHITSGVTEVAAAEKAFSASAADLFVNNADSGKLYYAAISGSTLLLYQDGSFKESLTLPAALSGSHYKTSTVVSSGTQYVLYTDSANALKVIGYSTAADAAAPVNTSAYPKISGENSSGFTIEANVDESAAIYYVAVAEASTAPTSAQVVAGVNYGDATVLAAGSFSALPGSTATKAVTDADFVAATDYDVYIAAKDNEGNLQAAPTKVTATTGIPAGSVSITGVSDLNANQDERDIQIVFGPAADETKVSAYRVFAVPTADAALFDLAAAEAVSDAANYVAVSKSSISGGSYTVSLPDGAKTAAGTAVAINTSYKLFVLSMATGTATINSLAGPSAAVSAVTNTGTLVLGSTTPEVGDSVTITVTDQDENHSASVSNTVPVTVTSTADATGISVTLTETGVNSGVFTGTMTLNRTGSNDTTDLIHAHGGETVTAHYTDAVKADGTVDAAVTAAATVAATQLVPPIGLTVSGTTVSWNAVSNASSYTVTVKKGGTNVTGLVDVANATTSFNLSGRSLPGGTDYTVLVKAIGDVTNFTDSSASAASAAVTLPALQLSTPTGFSVSSTTISWGAVSNVTSYEVEIFRGGVSVGGELAAVSTGTTTSIDLSGRSLPGGSYTVKVTAKGDGTVYSDSAKSAASGAATLPAVQLSSPSGLSVTGTTATWSAVTNAVGYSVHVVKQVSPEVEINLGTVTVTELTYNLITFAEHANCVAETYSVFVSALGDGTAYSNSINAVGSVTLSPKTPKATAGNITVTRKSDTKVDAVVTGLAAGDVVKVYAAASGGTALQTVTVASGASSAAFTDLTVTSSAGNLYFSNTTTARSESDRVQKAYTQYSPPASSISTGTSVRIISSDGGTIDGTLTKTTDGVQVKIGSSDFKTITAGAEPEVTIDTGNSIVRFDGKAADFIGTKAGSGDIVLTVEKADDSSLAVLSDEERELIGDRPVYDFSLTTGGTLLSEFNGGYAHISLAYTLQPGEDKDALMIYYIDDSGTLQYVRSAYNEETGKIEFAINHFSTYAVGYNKVVFTDVAESAWFCDAVTFCAARGITLGVGNDLFAPESTLTRGQFIVMLMRAYNIEPEETLTDNYADAGSTYYTNYLGTAKKLGISTGTGENMFAPDKTISREEMFTLLYRTLNILDALPDTSSGKSLTDFSDSSKISSYAQTALEALVASGIVSGSDGKLSPGTASTRAQMAAVLYKLLSE